MNHAVRSLKQADVIAYAGVTMTVLLYVSFKWAPCTQVAPTKRGRKDVNFVCLFHDSIIYRDVFTLRIDFVNQFLFALCPIERPKVFKQLGKAWLVHTERINDGIDIPNENAGVPKVIVFLHILFGYLEVRLFFKRIHAIDVVVRRWRVTQVGFDISVTGLRMPGLDA